MTHNTYLTITDLCDALDWSGVEDESKLWKRFNLPTSADPEAGFPRRFRQTLLAYALSTEIVGPLPDQTLERQNSARLILKHAGVWDAVVDWLIENGILGPADRDASAQLTFDFGLRNVASKEVTDLHAF